ncbi:MAG: hypothetical protein JWN27_560 [Candidatus Eremiobacteraeota bacterium]|nr:hypothetical protein [Candidatus Eremiobacteraeota bacterium]
MTTTAPLKPMSLETILSGSWTLFRRNWIVALPMVFVTIGLFVAVAIVVVVAAVSGLAITTAKGAPSPGFVAALAVGYLICLALFALAALAATAATYGMADAAWERGTATFADGAAVVGTRTGALFVAVIGFVGAGIVMLILLIPTLGIAMLALPVVTMYVLPAVLCGGYGGFDAFRESWRLVRRYLGTSAIAILILLAIQYLITMVMYVGILPLEFGIGAAASGSGHAPNLGLVIPLFVLLGVVLIVTVGLLYAFAGYHTLAIVGLYRWLRARAAAEDAAALVAGPGAVPGVPLSAAPEPPAAL